LNPAGVTKQMMLLMEHFLFAQESQSFSFDSLRKQKMKSSLLLHHLLCRLFFGDHGVKLIPPGSQKAAFCGFSLFISSS